MKRFALLLLLGAFVAPPFTFARDDDEKRGKQPAKPETNVRRLEGRPNVRLRQNPSVQGRVQTPARVQTAVRPPRLRTPNVAITANPEANVNTTNRGLNRWRNRGNWNDDNRNNNPNNNRRWDNDDDDDGGSSDRDWQNRRGNWQDDRNRWSNNRRWDRRHRNRAWWRSNYTRFALFAGGYYYWNGGYWYPAYGYDPRFTTYAYDAPIYAYNDQDPGEVIAQVQAALERRGYPTGGVDGSYGPMTRRALLNYQRDNGLPASGHIDEETLDSLGLR